MSVATLVGAFLLVAPATTMPAGAPTSDLSAVVQQLISDDLAAREAARQSLLALGDDALPALQAARAAARDPDAQVRLDTLLVQVRERADVGATKVTLQFTDTPIDVVLESLGKQARMVFGNGDLAAELAAPNGLPRVTLDLRQASFWTALRKIQDEGNVVFFPQADGWRVGRNFGQPNTMQGVESGAFLMQPSMASYQRTIGYNSNFGGGEHFTLQFQVLCEPKVKLTSGAGSFTIDRAVDSNGNDLIGAQRVTQIHTNNGQNMIGCNLALRYPKNPGATISEISGTMTMALARRTEQIQSDDLLADRKVEGTVDGVTIRLEVVSDETLPNSVAFRATIESAGDIAAMQRMQQNFQQQIRITDSKDAPLRLASFSQTRADQRVSEFRISYMSPQPQRSSGPYKLRIEVPTGFRELDVPLVMRDLKMP